MTEVKNTPPQSETERQLGTLKTKFQKALLEPSGSSYAFHLFPTDRPVRPGEEAIDQREILRRDIDDFFGFMEEVLSLSQDELRHPSNAAHYKDNGTTFFGRSLEPTANVGEFPRDQLWITERGLVDSGGDPPPNRPDVKYGSKRTGIIEDFMRLSERNTEAAVRKKDSVMRDIASLSRQHIETRLIQFQGAEDESTFNPKLGIIEIMYLDGYQAFPVVFKGERTIIMYDEPLVEPQTDDSVLPDEIRSQIKHEIIRDEEYRGSDVSHIVTELVNRAELDKAAGEK